MRIEAGPGRAAGAGLLALAGVLAVVGLTTDAGGALLALPAAVAAAALGLRDLVLVPVLRADAAGLDVVVGLRRRCVDWDDVEQLRVVTDRRAVLLELGLATGEVLLLSRARLGRDPRDVLEELRALRPLRS